MACKNLSTGIFAGLDTSIDLAKWLTSNPNIGMENAIPMTIKKVNPTKMANKIKMNFEKLEVCLNDSAIMD